MMAKFIDGPQDGLTMEIPDNAYHYCFADQVEKVPMFLEGERPPTMQKVYLYQRIEQHLFGYVG